MHLGVSDEKAATAWQGDGSSSTAINLLWSVFHWCLLQAGHTDRQAGISPCRLSMVVFCGRIRDLFWRRPQTRKVGYSWSWCWSAQVEPSVCDGPARSDHSGGLRLCV